MKDVKEYTLTESCKLLGNISPVTLRAWCKQAGFVLEPNQADPRIKTLRWDQLQQLAARHGRVLDAMVQEQPEFISHNNYKLLIAQVAEAHQHVETFAAHIKQMQEVLAQQFTEQLDTLRQEFVRQIVTLREDFTSRAEAASNSGQNALAEVSAIGQRLEAIQGAHAETSELLKQQSARLGQLGTELTQAQQTQRQEITTEQAEERQKSSTAFTQRVDQVSENATKGLKELATNLEATKIIALGTQQRADHLHDSINLLGDQIQQERQARGDLKQHVTLLAAAGQSQHKE